MTTTAGGRGRTFTTYCDDAVKEQEIKMAIKEILALHTSSIMGFFGSFDKKPAQKFIVL